MKLFFLILFSTISNVLFAHETHFAFAEVEYNWDRQRVEASIRFSTRDFEHSLAENNIPIKHLEYYTQDSLTQFFIADKILQGFELIIGKEKCHFNYLGYDVANNGQTTVFFESDNIAFAESFYFTFDLMMNENSEQQNKLTLIVKDTKNTCEFTQNNRTNLIRMDFAPYIKEIEKREE